MHLPRALLLQWHLTDRCNLRCRHCYQEGYQGEEMALAELVGVLDQFQAMLAGWRQAGKRVKAHVTVSGGEPFIRPDFLEFLGELSARRRAMSFAILTNGTLIDDDVAQRLAKLKPAFVQVSLDGVEATHDALRGRGNFAAVVAAVRRLVRRRVPAMISFSAHRGNFREFPDVARLACELRVKRVWSDRVIPCGSGATLAAEAMSPDETRELFELMRSARAEAERRWRNRTEVSLGRALQFLVGGGEPYQCTAGDRLLTLLPNGDLLPCRRLPIVVGNVRRTPLAELYQTAPLLTQLRDRDFVPAACVRCPYRDACRGGLRCLAYAVTNDWRAVDPGCWLAGQANFRLGRC